MIEYLLNYCKELNLDNFLEFIKFIIPTILSIWAIVYIRKSRFYYVEQRNIKLYDDIIKKIKGISIKYKENDINENLILFNGTIILKSHNDVKKDEIDKELTIYSPDVNAVWKHFEIVKSSRDYAPEHKINGNEIIIEKSMLKANDFISFAGLLDSKNTNLVIGHRIFNIIPRSLNFKENNLSFYKIFSILYGILFAFLIVLSLYSLNTRSKEKGDSTINERRISKEDSILYRTYDFKTKYYLNEKYIKLDSLKDNYEKKKEKENSIIEKINDKELDSLTKIYRKNKTYKNEVQVLKKLIDNTQVSLHSFQNPYRDIENASRKMLFDIVSKNGVKNDFYYKINDTINVKFFDSQISSNILIDDEKIDYIGIIMSFIGYLLGLFVTVSTIVFTYKYYRLKKLKKLYN